MNGPWLVGTLIFMFVAGVGPVVYVAFAGRNQDGPDDRRRQIVMLAGVTVLVAALCAGLYWYRTGEQRKYDTLAQWCAERGHAMVKLRTYEGGIADLQTGNRELRRVFACRAADGSVLRAVDVVYDPE